ncbi:hypothetical protein HPB50_023439 [Hyalomma asiaticum]|uniref:Uncharacterized protein n=1 Tax=Hyalomma asiaticum TaxID=266040 RepID=A0ACB7TMQ3_HYAAI|nr:hypothetical protein HPB50_023439 [Hyalomma asiaticum]
MRLMAATFLAIVKIPKTGALAPSGGHGFVDTLTFTSEPDLGHRNRRRVRGLTAAAGLAAEPRAGSCSDGGHPLLERGARAARDLTPDR